MWFSPYTVHTKEEEPAPLAARRAALRYRTRGHLCCLSRAHPGLKAAEHVDQRLTMRIYSPREPKSAYRQPAPKHVHHLHRQIKRGRTRMQRYTNVRRPCAASTQRVLYCRGRQTYQGAVGSRPPQATNSHTARTATGPPSHPPLPHAPSAAVALPAYTSP